MAMGAARVNAGAATLASGCAAAWLVSAVAGTAVTAPSRVKLQMDMVTTRAEAFVYGDGGGCGGRCGAERDGLFGGAFGRDACAAGRPNGLAGGCGLCPSATSSSSTARSEENIEPRRSENCCARKESCCTHEAAASSSADEAGAAYTAPPPPPVACEEPGVVSSKLGTAGLVA